MHTLGPPDKVFIKPLCGTNKSDLKQEYRFQRELHVTTFSTPGRHCCSILGNKEGYILMTSACEVHLHKYVAPASDDEDSVMPSKLSKISSSVFVIVWCGINLNTCLILFSVATWNSFISSLG